MKKGRLINEWSGTSIALIQHNTTAIADELCCATTVLCRDIDRQHNTDHSSKSFRFKNEKLIIDVLRGFKIPTHGSGQLVVITERETGFVIVLRGEMVKRNFEEFLSFELSNEYANDMERICRTISKHGDNFENVKLLKKENIVFSPLENPVQVKYNIEGREYDVQLQSLYVVAPCPEM